MSHIEYLGFVVRHDAKEAERVVAACVAKLSDKGEVVWKVYPPGKQNFIPMLFVTSVLVKQKLAQLTNVKDGVPADKALLKKPNAQFDFILNHLYDVRSKPESYTSLPDDLRQAVRFFFVLHGQKTTVRLQAPQGGLQPAQIFFWTRSDFVEQTNKQQLPKTPTEISVKNDPPRSNPDIALRIPLLAENVRLYLARPESWQKLYKNALKAPKDLPIHQMPLYGSQVDLTKEKEQPLLYKEQHLQLSEMIKRHRMVLLTGPSGSGKTTVLKMLVVDLLGPNPPIPDCVPIFISLKDVGFKGKSITDLIVNSVVKQILNSDSLKPTIQQQIDIWRAHYGDIANPRLLISTKGSKKQMVKSLFAAEVREFFTSNEKKRGAKIALFLDGYNEIPETEEHNAEQEIQQLSEKVNKIVVSTHSYGAAKVLTELTRFELEELSDQQIIGYLNRSLDGKGEEFFDHKIATNGRILSMARVPFYLELIVEYHYTYPDRRVPTCQGPLLEFFVRKQYEKKQDVKAQQVPKITEPRINNFLSKVAHRLIDKGKEKPETVLSFPGEVSAILPSFTMVELEETAKAAELFGFLEKSGQISEEPGATGAISFRHDNIRNYFAAQEFKNKKVFDNIVEVESYLEYIKWDNVWLMLFGILESEKGFEKALLAIAELDPIFASRCLLAFPSAKANHSDLLLKFFSLPRIHILTRQVQPGKSLASDKNVRYEKDVLLQSLSRIFSLCPPEHLCNIYFEPSTDYLVKGAIPWALVIAHAEYAFDYLQGLVQQQVLACHPQVLSAIGSLKRSEAHKLLVKLYHQAVQEQHDIEPLLGSLVEHWDGQISIEWLLETAKLFQRSFARGPHYPHYIRRLLGPLKYGEVGNVENWLELYQHSDPYISQAARHALRRVRHPIIIEEIINKYQAIRIDDFPEDCWIDFIALNDAENAMAEKAFLRLLERVRVEHNCRIIRMLACILDTTKSFPIIKSLVSLGLHCNCVCTMRVFYWLGHWKYEMVKDLIHSEINGRRLSAAGRKRAIIGLGLCGDSSVKSELLTIFTEHLHSVIEVSNNPSKKQEQTFEFFDYICKAVSRTKANKAKPVLKKIDKKSSNKRLVNIVREALADFQDIYRTYREFYCDQLIGSIHHAPKDLDESADLIDYWKYPLFKWPISKVQQLLNYMRMSTELAIADGDTKTAQFYYYGTQEFRSWEIEHRFLHIFRGWPTMPPPKSSSGQTKCQ